MCVLRLSETERERERERDIVCVREKGRKKSHCLQGFIWHLKKKNPASGGQRKFLWKQANCPAEMTDREAARDRQGRPTERQGAERVFKARDGAGEKTQQEGKVFRGREEGTVFRESVGRGRACAVSLIWTAGRGGRGTGGGGGSRERQSGYCRKMAL